MFGRGKCGTRHAPKPDYSREGRECLLHRLEGSAQLEATATYRPSTASPEDPLRIVVCGHRNPEGLEVRSSTRSQTELRVLQGGRVPRVACSR
jgi:hypothetical protein